MVENGLFPLLNLDFLLQQGKKSDESIAAALALFVMKPQGMIKYVEKTPSSMCLLNRHVYQSGIKSFQNNTV